MSINSQDRLLPRWFERIAARETVLPRFQRFEAWSGYNVTQLFNTILRDLPIGSLLVLEIGNEEPFISRPLVGAPEKGERVSEHVLDGQQRLTALWRGFHNNYEDRTYFLYLQEDEESGTPQYVDAVGRWTRDGDKERRPFWANDPREQWRRRMVPLNLVSPDSDTSDFRKWARLAIEDSDEREVVSDLIADIRKAFSTFNLPFLSLPVSTPRDTALDVFIKMNTSAEPLSIYDITVAQVEASMETSLHDMVANLREETPSLASYYPPEQLALYASALLQGQAPTNATYLTKNFGALLLEQWPIFLRGASKTVEFLEQERIFDSARLPTDVVMPVLTALWGLAPEGLDSEGRARVILRKYLWRAFFTNRYERSTGSRSFVDFQELRELIIEGIGAVESLSIFDETQHPLPQAEQLVAAGWPVRKDRLARAILALALRQGGHDLADGSSVSRVNLSKREYHHLYPVAHLARQGVPDAEAFRSLNCGLVTWKTNRNISDKEPEKYLGERLEYADVTEQDVKARFATHLIPFEAMKGDYRDFLALRAGLIREALEEVC